MANKYQLITELYRTTLLSVTETPQAWKAFLRSACNSYKCPFDEQVLIYAQKPEATAVLEMEKWNTLFGRWVNKGATGIAVFEEKNGRSGLKYYFDVADTHESRYAKPVPVWQMEQAFEPFVAESLENSFGTLAEKESFPQAVLSAGKNLMANNIADYLAEIVNTTAAVEIVDRFPKLVENSISYMALARMGFPADEYIPDSAFAGIEHFDSVRKINCLGTAVSDIAETELRVVAKTVGQFFAKSPDRAYDESRTEEKTAEERSVAHGSDIQNGERRADSQPDNTRAGGSLSGQIRTAAESISEGTQESGIHNAENNLPADTALSGNGTDRQEDGRTAHNENGTGTENQRGNEREESSGMDGGNEQSETFGGGNGPSGADLQVTELPPFLSEPLIEAIILDDPGRKKSRQEINQFFRNSKDTQEKIEYMKNAYSDTFVELLIDKERIGYRKQPDGLLMWEGNYLSRTSESVFSWGIVAEFFESYMEKGRHSLAFGAETMPNQAEQLNLFSMPETEITNAIADEEKPIYHAKIPQEVIDKALYTGESETVPYAVAARYSRDILAEERIAFLKTVFQAESGFGILHEKQQYTVWFTENGLDLSRGKRLRNGFSRTSLSWVEIDKRIETLLAEGTYLSQTELEKAKAFEFSDVSQRLLYLYGDIDQENEENRKYLPIIRGIRNISGGYPVWEQELPKLLAEKSSAQAIYEEFKIFSQDYAQNRDILRFHYHRVGDLERDLELLILPKREFTAQQDFQRQCQKFISENEVEKVLSGGSSISGGKFRIYSYFSYPHSLQEKADFLKKEYGTGGVGYKGFSESHDAKGIEIKKAYDGIAYDRRFLKWTDVARIVESLVAFNKYMTPKQLEGIPQYEKEEIAKGIYHFFRSGSDLPAMPFRAEDDYYTATETIVKQLSDTEKVKEILQTMQMVLDGTDTTDRQYESMQKSFETLQKYSLGKFTLFNGKHRAEEKIIPETAAYEETKVPNKENSAEAVIENESRVEAMEMLIGQTVVADGRSFIVESIHGDRASLRDTTFQGSTGFPIYRNESLTFVKDHLVMEQEPLAEVPQAIEQGVEKRNYHITDTELGIGTPTEKYQNNITAIRLLKELESENRLATAEEQAVLAKYVGWGGLADCFSETNRNYVELKGLLTEEEFSSARESTLTAFYTQPTVIKAIYQGLSQMGFETGNILEPSCGTGNFLGLLPESMENSRIYGVELDSISGRIAKQLYQKADIRIQGFENADFSDSFFDVAIGNVPFGQFKVSDKRYEKNNFLIHDYFFGKALDQVRPGGVIAFITSKGTMDKENTAVRKYIAQRAELLGAIRLPNNAFKANAGTEVTSDILFLQKRDRIMDITPDWVHTGKDENGISMNEYFISHSQMILGKMENVSGPFGMEAACLPFPDKSLEELLHTAVSEITGRITDYEREDLENETVSIPADNSVRNFSYTLVDGEIYYRENSRMFQADVPKTAQSRIKGMIELRDCVRELIDMQVNDFPDEAISGQQKKLNTLYDAFTEKYGLINSRGNNTAFSEDSSYFLLCSLEILDEDRKLKRKADFFTKRTIRSHKAVEKTDSATEALAVSIGEKAKVDMAYMEHLTGKSEKEIFSDLQNVIFLNPEYEEGKTAEKYLTADEYLSGNVREKLAFARIKAQENEILQTNVSALEQVQPKDLTASEISVRLGATWLKPDYVKQFVFETLSTPRWAQYNIKVHFSEITGEWRIEGKNQDRGNIKATNTFGTKRINAYSIIEETLNLKDVRIFDYHEDADGKRTAVLNKQETAIAQSKQEAIKDAFAQWIWKDHERREDICRTYNVLFNSNRPREYDGSHIVFNGMNPEITLRKHQVNAIAHILYGGNTLLAHCVGAGKTFEMTAAAMESKRLGLCQKSMFVVPNHLTEQWAGEFLQLYPSANILVATKKDFETANRKKFCGRIATGEYDAVIIGHSQFEKIPMSAERQRTILEQQIAEIVMGIEEVKRNRGENFTIKQMEKTKKNLQAKLNKLNDQSRKDDVVTFEELGVDRLFIDESHYYKNLFLSTKMRNVGGIAQTEAQKSTDLFMKCCYLDEITDGRGIVFATGTPISNSMVELYTIQRYLQYGTLQKHRLQHFDSWASNFGETVTAIELSPEGTGYRTKTRFAKFYNLPELMSMFKNIADIQTADMIRLPVPKANYHNIALKPSEIQKEMVQELGERAERVRNKMVDSNIDNMLLITNDGRKLALDQRLINPMLGDSETSKATACAENVFEIWRKTEESRSTQMIFCDLSTPKNDGSFNVYDDIKKKLTEKGIPENEIAYIHNAKTEMQKKELFNKVREGTVRVLMGSTAKMGAGTNVQQKLIALHHTDCPWRPSDLQQREGRIIRQGNENKEVDIYSYVTEQTFDSYLYQLVESKQKFISQIMTSKSPVRSAEDVDETALNYAEIKALASGNPLIKDKMNLDIEVSKLKMLKSTFLNQRYALEDKIIKYFPVEIAETKERLAAYNEDIKTVKENTRPNVDGFTPMELKGTVYSDKKAAGTELLSLCACKVNADRESIGSYKGLRLDLEFDKFSRTFVLGMEGKQRYKVELGGDVFGNIQRMDNFLEALPVRENNCKRKLEELDKQLETAKVEVKKEFEKEDELAEKSKRLEELNVLLNEDNKKNDTQEVSTEKIEKKNQEWER